MNQQETQEAPSQTPSVITLQPAHKAVLGLEDYPDTLHPSYARYIRDLARVRRDEHLGGIALPTDELSPSDIYRLYGLPVENRIGAAMAATIMENMTPFIPAQGAAPAQYS